MRSMFCQNLLLAFDGTEGSQKALEKTMALVKENAHIKNVHLLYVDDSPKMIAGEAYIVRTEDLKTEPNRESVEKLKQAKAVLSPYLTCTSEIIKNENPSNAIVEHAKQHDYDLIVIGSRGLGGVKKLFLGSVSSQVVQQAAIPVLVVK